MASIRVIVLDSKELLPKSVAGVSVCKDFLLLGGLFQDVAFLPSQASCYTTFLNN